MKTAVAETSREAFHSLSPARYLQPKEQQVMVVFRTVFILRTRQELAAELGWGINLVCGRVRSLLDKKALAVRGWRIDPGTRKRQELLGLPVAAQGRLF